MDELKELVEKIIKREFPNAIEEFSEENKKFIIEYSINKNPSTTDALKESKSDIDSETEYYKKYPKVKELKSLLQDGYNRFRSLQKRDPKAFDNEFSNFLNWWYDQESKCYYCSVASSTVEDAFDCSHGEPLIFSEKPSFSGKLQIDKKTPENGYNEKNCVFACVLCNNAKSDMISEEDFKKFIAPAFSDYWKEIEKRLKGDKGGI